LVHWPGRVFYGWWVVSAVSALYALGSGIYWSGFSFYFLPVARELGLSRTSMSLAFGLARLIGGLQGPIAGYLVDRLSPRVMIIFGGALGGLGFILLARTHSYLSFLLVYLGLMVIGFSGGFDLGIMSVANRWFVRHKARAMAFLWVGLALGTAFIAPAVGLMVVNLGWRDTATISGAALLVLLVPALLVIRNLPEGMGLLPDGQRTSSLPIGGSQAPVPGNPTAAEAPVSPQPYSQADLTAKQGFRTVWYWLLALAMGLRVAAHAGLMVHFVPMLVWKGQTEAGAALLIGIYGLAVIPLTLAVGWAGDRWSKQKVASGGMLLGGLSLTVLLFSSGQLWQLTVFVVLLAMTDSSGVLAWAFVGDRFGRRAFTTLLGGMTLVYSLLSATTPILAGWIFDSTGSYLWALVLLALLFASSSLLFWNIPRPKGPAGAASPGG
jgi:MFS family permease